MTEMQEWAKFYEANNLTYFPLFGIMNGACRCRLGVNCTNMGKHPIFAWKDKPRRTPSDTDNIGVSTDNLVVIDLDGDVGESALADYPCTFTTTTGHGFHLWYRADRRKNVKSIVGWKRKVDIRACGGIVVAPPSRHKSGAQYRAFNDSPIVSIPDDLLYALPERSKNYNRTGQPASVELVQTPSVMFPMVGRLIAEMMDFGDHGRNQTLFRVACRFYEMSSKNLMGEDALNALSQAALDTGLTQDEVERTLASARRSV